MFTFYDYEDCFNTETLENYISSIPNVIKKLYTKTTQGRLRYNKPKARQLRLTSRLKDFSSWKQWDDGIRLFARVYALYFNEAVNANLEVAAGVQLPSSSRPLSCDEIHNAIRQGLSGRQEELERIFKLISTPHVIDRVNARDGRTPSFPNASGQGITSLWNRFRGKGSPASGNPAPQSASNPPPQTTVSGQPSQVSSYHPQNTAQGTTGGQPNQGPSYHPQQTAQVTTGREPYPVYTLTSGRPSNERRPVGTPDPYHSTMTGRYPQQKTSPLPSNQDLDQSAPPPPYSR